MPYTTDFWGKLVTDKPIPEHIQEHLEYLFDLDTRSLSTPLQNPLLGPGVPDGFPAYDVAKLPVKGMYRCDLCLDTDTEIVPSDTEYPSLSAKWVQFIIDTFLQPNGIKATGRIEAAGESGVSDLWCIDVGDDQVARIYQGFVAYDDEPSYPEPDEEPGEESYCEECQAGTEPEFRSAPSPDHYDTCSLYVPDPENE
jgi:hypothetical protein